MRTSTNTNRMGWARLDNQQNKKKSLVIYSNENIDKITGWDDEKPLLQYNLNTLGSRFNKIKQYNETRKPSTFQNFTQSKLSQYRKRTTKISSSTSQRNIQGQFQYQSTQNTQPQSQALRYQFSNIQLLKFEVKHLDNDEISKNRFPTFQGTNKTQLISNQIQQNVNQFQLSQGYQIARKIRTQSTKRKKKQLIISQHAGYPSKQIINTTVIGTGTGKSTNTTSTNQKFYKTLTNQSTNNNHNTNNVNKNNHNLIIQPYVNLQNYICPSKQLKYDMSVQMNTQKKQQFKTIHWKKNKPFTKFFQSKKNKLRNISQVKQRAVSASAKGYLKQVQGRKLYQLLTLNRQLIQIDEF